MDILLFNSRPTESGSVELKTKPKEHIHHAAVQAINAAAYIRRYIIYLRHLYLLAYLKHHQRCTNVHDV